MWVDLQNLESIYRDNMLISNQKIADGDIVSFKISNGDEIVAKVVSQTDATYLLSKPCLVVPSERGIGLMQAMFSGNPDKNVELNKSSVMMMSETIDQLQTHYLKTTTGIEPITRGSIIT